MKIIAAIIAVLAALYGGALAHAQSSPDAALDALHKAAEEKNPAAFAALLTDDVVFLGIDGGARLEGESARDFFSESFDDGQGWAYRSSDRAMYLSVDGGVAWFDEVLVNGETGSRRGTGVLVRQGEDWKLAQYNLMMLPADTAVGSTPPVMTAVKTDATSSASASPPSPQCRQKRHKTNKKGGC
jgi:ketosteroid isomerase-like protein